MHFKAPISSGLSQVRYQNPVIFISPGIAVIHRKEDPAEGKRTDEHHFKVFHNNNIIAWYVLCFNEENVWLLRIRFLCEEIDFKISKAIHAYIEEWAHESGIKAFEVQATSAGAGFFTELGYSNLRDEDTETGITVHRMKKEIKP